MPRSPYALAALTTVAIPGFRPIAVRPTQTRTPGCDAADVVDPKGTMWTVRAPRNSAGSVRLERELAIWNALSKTKYGALPVGVPQVAGHIDLDEGTRCIVHKRPDALPIVVYELTAKSALLHDVATALAVLHDTDLAAVADLDMPVFTAEQYRQRRLAEVRSAVGTGSVPGTLAIRWEEALTSGPAWDFTPTLTHGDLVSDHVLVKDQQLVTITGWSEIKIADPADDLAWLLAGTIDEVAKSALNSYLGSRPEADAHLLFRSRLAGELSIARWLLHGMSLDDREIISSARRMLRELARDVTG